MNVHSNIAHKIVGLEFEIFIKNVVAVAAYIRLASQSQSKFQNKELSAIPVPVRTRACAEHGICLSFALNLA